MSHRRNGKRVTSALPELIEVHTTPRLISQVILQELRRREVNQMLILAVLHLSPLPLLEKLFLLPFKGRLWLEARDPLPVDVVSR